MKLVREFSANFTTSIERAASNQPAKSISWLARGVGRYVGSRRYPLLLSIVGMIAPGTIDIAFALAESRTTRRCNINRKFGDIVDDNPRKARSQFDGPWKKERLSIGWIPSIQDIRRGSYRRKKEASGPLLPLRKTRETLLR